MPIKDATDFPVRAIESYNLYTGQTPIDKGFAMGGITAFKTKQQFDTLTVLGDLSANYAFNMQAANGEIFIGIPLVSSKRKTEGKRIASLMISGKFRWTNNTNPVWKQPQRIKQGELDLLSTNPLRLASNQYGNGTFPNADYVVANDFVKQQVPENAGERGVYPYVKLFIPVAKNASLTLGNYSIVDEKKLATFNNRLFNARRNGVRTRRNFNSYLRWNHQFTMNKNLNIAYEAGVQYANRFYKIADPILGNHFFDYGYIGKFITYKTPIFERGSATIDGTVYNDVQVLNSWDYDTLVSWESANTNPEMAAYTQNLYDFADGKFKNFDEIWLQGGLINGGAPGRVNGQWNAAGTPYPTYEKRSEEKIRAYFQTEVTYKNHHILFGGEYNRETKRHYSLSPTSLWNLMRSLTNFHLRELDPDNPIAVEHNGQVDTVIYNRKYDAGRQMVFDKNLRKTLGLPENGLDFIMVDSYDKANNTISYYDQGGIMHTINTPKNLFNINLFSAAELLNDGNSYVSYSGYDYLGNPLHGSADPYAFFKNFTINAEKPEYGAAYIQDNFQWKNLHVSLGLRADVYDANHPVLRDNYSLFAINTVKEALAQGNLDFIKPDNIGDDYVVYVDDVYSPHKVAGFRQGDNWFDALGNQITDPSLLDLGAGIAPYLKYPQIGRISNDNWRPDLTFQMYKKAINLLPQISLDYSLTKRLNLYFTYNSFTSNPTVYSDFCPDVYQYWSTFSSQHLLSNPNLKPMRTSKLFAGIKGILWKNLVGNLSFLQTAIDNFFYSKFFFGAYPSTYLTVANASDRISTNGYKASLQWVNNSVSGFTGGLNFVKLFPDKKDKNYFQVSDLVFSSHIGYRFSNKNVALKGVAVTLYYQYRHGTPYPYTNANGILRFKNTPPINLCNLNLQKEFFVGKRATLLAYLTIENLFNFKNVFSVYPATGSATDDGFLSNPANQNLIDNQLSPDSFRFLYRQHLYNPQLYDIPRIARFGIILKY